jgi:tetratricopeptide (TPR) repeat protein
MTIVCKTDHQESAAGGAVFMKLKIAVLTLAVTFAMSVFLASADEWDDLIKEALKQRPSESKRRTRSGKRLLHEKTERLRRIDAEVPLLMRQGEYSAAEELLKEAFRLTIELYDPEDINVAERFVYLGIVYMEAGKPEKAVKVFERARGIGERIYGKDSYRIANIYRFLAAACYGVGRYEEATESAASYLVICQRTYSDNDPRTEYARELVKQIEQARRTSR